MASEGPNSPGTVISEAWVSSTTAWTNPGNASSSNDSYAVASSINDEGNCEALKATGFGFAIPGTATIVGIVATAEGHALVGDTTDFSASMRLVIGGTISPEEENCYARVVSPAWPIDPSDSTLTFGAEDDTWAVGSPPALTPTDINDADFGVALVGLSAWPPADFYVDHITITVHYTESATGPANLKSCAGVAKASIKKICGVDLANIKSVSGVV